MRVQVLGSGCARCNELYDHARQAAERFGEAAPVVEKVDDVDTFIRLGVRTTPALALDEEVVSMGKVLSVDEIARLIEERSGDGA
jgi:small redox-active disulfide protein 2